jgi:hypothetical protein
VGWTLKRPSVRQPGICQPEVLSPPPKPNGAMVQGCSVSGCLPRCGRLQQPVQRYAPRQHRRTSVSRVPVVPQFRPAELFVRVHRNLETFNTAAVTLSCFQRAGSQTVMALYLDEYLVFQRECVDGGLGLNLGPTLPYGPLRITLQARCVPVCCGRIVHPVSSPQAFEMGSPATAHVTVLAFRTALVERALPGVDGCADQRCSWLSRPEPQAREVAPRPAMQVDECSTRGARLGRRDAVQCRGRRRDGHANLHRLHGELGAAERVGRCPAGLRSCGANGMHRAPRYGIAWADSGGRPCAGHRHASRRARLRGVPRA